RAQSFVNAEQVINSLFNNWHVPFHGSAYTTAILFSVILIISDVLFYNQRADTWLGNKISYIRWTFYATMLFCIMCYAGVESLPFIYFQF
ncbi:MAG: hypothetical protein ACXVC7_09665, partial [Bacteroidia bacterium]